MNKEILKKYKIEFVNMKSDDEIDKSISGGNIVLVDYLLDLTSEEITQWAIPELNKVISGEVTEIDIDTEPVWAECFINNTILRTSWDNNKSFQLLTGDFKEILLSWNEFLNSNPK
jgi:predicted RNA-binding protein